MDERKVPYKIAKIYKKKKICLFDWKTKDFIHFIRS